MLPPPIALQTASTGVKTVLLRLWAPVPRDDGSPRCFASASQIAADLGLSTSVVRGHLAVLREHGWARYERCPQLGRKVWHLLSDGVPMTDGRRGRRAPQTSERSEGQHSDTSAAPPPKDRRPKLRCIGGGPTDTSEPYVERPSMDFCGPSADRVAVVEVKRRTGEREAPTRLTAPLIVARHTEALRRWADSSAALERLGGALPLFPGGPAGKRAWAAVVDLRSELARDSAPRADAAVLEILDAALDAAARGEIRPAAIRWAFAGEQPSWRDLMAPWHVRRARERAIEPEPAYLEPSPGDLAPNQFTAPVWARSRP